MRTSTNGNGRHRRRLSRVVPAGAALLALVGGGIVVATSYAGEPAPGTVVLPPEGMAVAASEDDGTTVRPFLVGGAPASGSSSPWMVQLVREDARGAAFVCGGTLVAPTKVLTAAHCLHDPDGRRQDWGGNGSVAFGTTDSVTVSDKAKFVDVTRSWVSEGYDPDTFANDIGILTLAKPVKGATLAMAGPGDAALYAPGTKGTAYGWGLTGSDGRTAELSPKLLKVGLTVQSDAACTENFRANIGGGFQPGRMICTGPLATGDDDTARTTCPGDSGGPLVAGGKIVGVVSWGISEGSKVCNVAGTFEVFGKVSTYRTQAWARVDDADFTRNGRADLFLRGRTAGKGYVLASTGSGFGARTTLSGSWSGYDKVVQTDLDRDGHQDFVVRRKSDGAVYRRHRTVSSSTYTNTELATGWKTRRAIIAPGDVTGDRLPDLVSVTSGGTLLVHPGRGDGTVGASVTGGKGYQAFGILAGKGDLTGDGRPDLVARGGAGKVYLLKGTGKASAPFEKSVQVGTWTGYDRIASPGDVTGDGRADLVTRTPGGTLHLHPGTGRAGGEIFNTAIKVGTGYKGYDILG